MKRRRFSSMVIALAPGLLTAVTGEGRAADAAPAGDYPSRQIEIVVAFPAGGGTDIIARAVSEQLFRAWGQPVVVNNKNGASGAIGTQAVARAKPDGYTLLMATSNVTITPAIDPTAKFHPVRDFTPITVLSESPFVLVANPSVPARTLVELIDYSRKNPHAVNYATSGAGTPQHLATELLCKLAGIKWTHVPYKGGATAVADLVAGHVQVMMSSAPTVLGHIGTGRLRALGVTSREPISLLPGVPPISSLGMPEMVTNVWVGLIAPAGIPMPVVAKLDAAVQDTMRKPEILDRLTREGSFVKVVGARDFPAYMADDAARWRRIAELTKITVE